MPKMLKLWYTPVIYSEELEIQLCSHNAGTTNMLKSIDMGWHHSSVEMVTPTTLPP